MPSAQCRLSRLTSHLSRLTVFGGSRMQEVKHLILRLVCGAIGIAATVVIGVLIWTWAASTFPSFIMPTLPTTLTRLGQGDIWPDAIEAGATLLTAFVRSASYGLTIGVIVGLTPIGYAILYPALRMLSMLPMIAMLPLFMLWFGLNPSPGGVHWPSVLAMLLVIATGVASALERVHESRHQVLTIDFPTATAILAALNDDLDGIFRSFRRAIEMGAIVLVTQELIGSTTGIGHRLMEATMRFDAPAALATVLAIWCMVMVLELLLYLIESVIRLILRQRRNAQA